MGQIFHIGRKIIKNRDARIVHTFDILRDLHVECEGCFHVWC